MRSLFLASSLLLLPVAAFGQASCGAPDASFDETLRLPPVIDTHGPPVPLVPSARPMSNPTPADPVSFPGPAPAARSETSAAPMVTPPAQSSSSPLLSGIPVMSKAQVDSFPALAHMTALGATILDLGISHGLQTVVARNDGQFMAFVISPDGQAVIAGLMTDISVPQMSDLAGENLVDLPSQHGMKALFLHNGPQFQVFYATPDGERLIPGVMWDGSGKDVTHDQISFIPGTVPTVVVGKDAVSATSGPGSNKAAPVPSPAPSAALSDVTAAQVSTVLEHTYPGQAGEADAQEVWMFIDPQCPFSVRAMRDLAPLIAQNRIRLSLVTLSFVDAHNNGASTRDALRLLSLPKDQMVDAWATGHLPDASVPMAGLKLQVNMRAAHDLAVAATPTFLWRKADGSLARFEGLPNPPADIGSMILAGRS